MKCYACKHLPPNLITPSHSINQGRSGYSRGGYVTIHVTLSLSCNLTARVRRDPNEPLGTPPGPSHIIRNMLYNK